MANNYLQYAFAFDIAPEEIEAFRRRAQECAEKAEEEGGDSELQFIIEDGEVFLYSEEYGDVEQVAELLQRFLTDHPQRKQQVLGFEWAVTCSKPRIHEFGGGACVVTANKKIFMNTGTWLQERIAKLSKLSKLSK